MAKRKYRLLGGSYTALGSKHEYHKGDIVETHDDVMVMFPGSFERVHSDEESHQAPSAAGIAVSIAAPKGKGKAGKQEASTAKPEDPRGDEVTDEFSLDKGLRVFRRGDFFHLYEGNSQKPINDQGLKTDKQVIAAAKKFLDE